MNVKIIKLIAAAAAIAISAGAMSAQDKWQERINNEKIAFLTSEMDLTTQEAQAFWPIYNEAKNEKEKLFREVMKAYKALDEGIKAGKTEKEMLTLVENYCAAGKAVNEADERYMQSCLKVLPAEKVARLLIGEEKFRRNQIHKLHRDDGPKKPAGGSSGNDRRR